MFQSQRTHAEMCAFLLGDTVPITTNSHRNVHLVARRRCSNHNELTQKRAPCCEETLFRSQRTHTETCALLSGDTVPITTNSRRNLRLVARRRCSDHNELTQKRAPCCQEILFRSQRTHAETCVLLLGDDVPITTNSRRNVRLVARRHCSDHNELTQKRASCC